MNIHNELKLANNNSNFNYQTKHKQLNPKYGCESGRTKKMYIPFLAR